MPKRFFGVCYKCHKYGHRREDCPDNTTTRSSSIGIYRFRCRCGNQFTGLCEGPKGSAKCYNCKRRYVRPEIRLNREHMVDTGSDNEHSCNLCDGNGRCPLFALRLYVARH